MSGGGVMPTAKGVLGLVGIAGVKVMDGDRVVPVLDMHLDDGYLIVEVSCDSRAT